MESVSPVQPTNTCGYIQLESCARSALKHVNQLQLHDVPSTPRSYRQHATVRGNQVERDSS